MDQNRKPGVPPTKDISDLKARLGLKRPDGSPPEPPRPAECPRPAARPAPGQPFPAAGTRPRSARARPRCRGAARAGTGSSPARGHEPLRQHARPHRGLRSALDRRRHAGAERRRRARGKTVLIASVIVGAAAFALGGGLGIASVGRANMNTANHAAKAVKGELDNMQKKLGEIGLAVARSQQRLAAAKKDTLSYDPQLIADLKAIKLDPRPNTATIFRVDFFRLPDADVDKLFNYYYDTIALYNEVERHIRRTDNDAESLKAYAEKTAAHASKNYGVVFDNCAGRSSSPTSSRSAIRPAREGGKDCGAATSRASRSARARARPGSTASIGAKLDLGNVVPIKPTPFMDAVMTGSPDQVRQESYKQRVANIRTLVRQLTVTQKELVDGISKDAARPDIFTVF